MKAALLLAIVSIAMLLLAGQLGWLAGAAPTDLGAREGKLKPPSTTRNSVSSQADLYPDHPQRGYADITPFALRPEGPEASMAAVRQAIEALPNATVVHAQSDYVYATARTRWLGFVDDLEFWYDPTTQAIHVRSASRLGREDFGVNRQRVEAIRERYQATGVEM